MALAKKLFRHLRRKRRPASSYSRPRRETLLELISVSSQTGLEIGPLASPLVSKLESHGRVMYVDSAPADDLRSKYRDDPNVNTDAIVEVDFLWGAQTLPELVGVDLYDYVIASHVIEHVPNMIGWMRETATVLRDGGILSLAIPDKRFTFDLNRAPTTLGTLLESHLLDRRRPSLRDLFEHRAFTRQVDLLAAWNGTLDHENIAHYGTLEQAWSDTQAYHKCNDYMDVHVTIVTPTSFIAILDDINRLGLLDFTVANFVATEPNTLEFFAALERTPRSLAQDEKVAVQGASIAAARSKIRNVSAAR